MKLIKNLNYEYYIFILFFNNSVYNYYYIKIGKYQEFINFW